MLCQQNPKALLSHLTFYQLALVFFVFQEQIKKYVILWKLSVY